MTLVYSDYGSPSNQGASARLKITVALSLGFIGSAMTWWYSCFSQEFLPQMILVIMFIVSAAFVILLAVHSRERLVNTTNPSEAPTKTRSLDWNVCKESKTPVAFIILLLTCLVVVLSDATRSTVHFNVIIYSAIMIFQRLCVGIGLPLTITDWID